MTSKNTNSQEGTEWQQYMQTLREKKATPKKEETAAESSEREIFYGIEIQDNLNRENFKVRLLQKERLSSGKMGKLKKFEISYRRHFDHLLCNEQDRNIFSMFKNFIDDDRYYSTSFQYFIIPKNLISFALKEISLSGRLVLFLDTEASYNAQTPYPMMWTGKTLPFQCKVELNNDNWEVLGHFPDLLEQNLDDTITFPQQKLLLTREKIYSLGVPENLDAYFKQQIENGPLSVPQKQKNAFLSFLKEFFPLENLEMPDELGATTQTLQGELHLEVEFKNDYFSAQAYFDYRGEKCVPFSGQLSTPKEMPAHVFCLKDLENEKKQLSQLNEIEELRLIDEDIFQFRIAASDFLGVIDTLEKKNISLKVRNQKVVRPSDFSTSVKSGIDWFEVHGKLQFEKMQLSVPQILMAAKENRQFIPLGNGEVGLLPKEWLEKCMRMQELASKHDNDSLHFDRSQAFLIDQMLSENTPQKDKPFQELLDKLKNHKELKPVKVSSKFKGELRSYQDHGLSWMTFLQDLSLGGCLADDMGLGKTIQVLALMQKRKLIKKRTSTTSCIIVPKSLVTNWQRETERFTPNIKILVYQGHERKLSLKDFSDYDLVIFTYGILRRDIQELSQFHFDYVILDEAQAIKNENSQTAKSSYLLKSSHRLALTGTPIENHLGELFSIFRFLIPTLFHKRIQSYKTLTGEDETAQMLLKGLKPFMLRRTKEKVLKELPEKTETVLWCEMEEQQRAEYDRVKTYYKTQLAKKIETDGLNKSKIQVLEALTRLRQVACHPGLIDDSKKTDKSGKIELLIDQLKTIKGEGKKALVFSQFTSMLALLKRQMMEHDLPYVYLDGKTVKRDLVINEFKNNDKVPFFLISLKAGGVGLNLTEASYCFLLDPWWNPAVESQAIDRAHRIGQTNKVNAYKLISKGTVEEKIIELQRKKKQLYEDVMSASDGFLKKISAEDITYLFS